MKKSELVAAVATKISKTQKEVEEVIDAMCEVIPEHVMQGEEVLTPMGKFKLKVTPPREGINPLTGEKLQLGETRRLVFKSSRAFKVKEAPATKKKTTKKR